MRDNRCTLMLNRWIDGLGMTILNFLVNCSKGTMFIKSNNASTYIENTLLLCGLWDGFIQEIGMQCVFQVIMNNVAMWLHASCL